MLTNINLALYGLFFGWERLHLCSLTPRVSCLSKKILIVGICPMSFRKCVMRPAHNTATLPISCLERLANESSEVSLAESTAVGVFGRSLVRAN